MKQKLWVCIVGAIVLGSIPYAAAQENEPVPMKEVVVTATRTETPPEKVGGSAFTVITAADIEAKKLNTVEEVLREVPGLDVTSTGGLGAQTSVLIRGADAKNTLVLVDGVIYNDPSSPDRSADLANLTVDNIERIEVVRGPLSALYGTNATAGVVNIITKKGRAKPTAYAGGEYGSYDTWKVYAGSDGRLKRFDYSLSLSKTETDGFSAANDDNPDIPHAGNTSEEDGWENTSLSTRAGFAFTDNFDINAMMRYLNSSVKLDDFGFGTQGFAADQFDFTAFPPALVPDGAKLQEQDSKQVLGKFNIHNFFFEQFLESDLYYKFSDQKKDGFDADGNKSYEFDGNTQETGWQGGLYFGESNLLSLGYNYYEEELESRTPSPDKKAFIRSYWISDQAYLLKESLVVVGGLRLDDHSRFGSETTFNIAPAYTLQRTGTTLKASYGTGFRAPSLFELFADPIPFAFNGGNPDLKPEKSKGWDAGFEQSVFKDRLKFGGGYFFNRFKDRIEFDFVGLTYSNLEGDTKTKGVEAFIDWKPLKNMDLKLDYTYTDTEDPDGESLVRRPKNKFHLNARYRFLEKAVANLDAYWVDVRKTIATATDRFGNPVTELDDYFLVNLALYYDLTRNIQLYSRIDNLFDEYYEEAWSYATPGFSVYGGLKLKI
jgi:vitamin B12 transporter